MARLEPNRPKVPANFRSIPTTELPSHRRVQSSLAQLGSATNGITGRHKPSVLSANSKTAAPLKKQAPKPASKGIITTRTVKPITLGKKTTATSSHPARTTQDSIGYRPRPHTSLSLTPRDKVDRKSNQQILSDQVVDEDFMFNVEG